MRKLYLKGAATFTLAIGSITPAMAQYAVFDAKAVAQQIETVRNTLKQVEEAQKLYDSFNSLSKIENVSQALNNPLLKNSLPAGISNSADLASDNLAALGALGSRAQDIVSGKNLALSGLDSALGDVQSNFMKNAEIGGKNQAYGEHMLETTQATGEGLNGLSQGLARATTQREAIDIGARAQIESAAINNRILQMMAEEKASTAAQYLQAKEKFAATQRAYSSK